MDVGDSLWRHSTYCDVIRGRDSRPPLEILYCYTHIHTKLECLLSLIGNNHHVVQVCMHVWCTMSKVTQNDFGCCYSKVDFFLKLFRCRFSCFQFVLVVFLFLRFLFVQLDFYSFDLLRKRLFVFVPRLKKVRDVKFLMLALSWWNSLPSRRKWLYENNEHNSFTIRSS